jgi:hypothetical protein
MKPVIAGTVSNRTPEGGVYLFSEGSDYLYAGRTKLKVSPGTTSWQASEARA